MNGENLRNTHEYLEDASVGTCVYICEDLGRKINLIDCVQDEHCHKLESKIYPDIMA